MGRLVPTVGAIGGALHERTAILQKSALQVLVKPPFDVDQAVRFADHPVDRMVVFLVDE